MMQAELILRETSVFHDRARCDKQGAMTDIPRQLVDRDPYNRQHLLAAMDLINRLRSMMVTKRTKHEVETMLGDAIAKRALTHVEVHDEMPAAESIVIGGFILSNQGMYFADNVVTCCATCQAPLQIRPHSTTATKIMCVFCVADETLQEHWAL
jgi:hypothetical protein